MPIYEYKCQGCGEVFEVRQKFSDEPVTVHEKCGAPVDRLISPPAFQFKGSGWYVTDYAKGGANNPKKSSSESSSSTDSGTKSESKPAESKPSSDSSTKSE